MAETLHFILVKDATRARFVRRKLAERNTQLGVIVGTFTSLLGHAQDSYLIADIKTQWDSDFQKCLSTQSAFWSKSYQVSPDETASIIKRELEGVISQCSALEDIKIENIEKLGGRSQNHLNDLLALYHALNNRLDDGHELLRQIIISDSESSLRNIQIYTDYSVEILSSWQQELICKLNNDSKSFQSLEFSELLQRPAINQRATALNAVQSHIFSPLKEACSLDETLQFVGVRDYQEEADIAAGMVQQMLRANKDLSEKDIGLLIPSQFEYSLVVKDAFDRAGLVLSGLSADIWKRDLGREVLFHFLYCRQTPAPAMALSVCLSSPLMPWTREQGAVLAQAIMDGDYRLRALPGATTEERAMLQCIAGGEDTPASLIEAIKSFVALINDHDLYIEHINTAKSTAEVLCERLRGCTEIPWKTLRRISSPKNIRSTGDIDYNQQGVTVWREDQFPWREVKHLLILGFCYAHYPESLGTTLVFSQDDLDQINNQCNINLITPEQSLKQRRQLFKDQLSHVSDSISFYIPRHNVDGERVSPSDSLVFIEKILVSPANMILEIDAASDRQQIRFLAQTNDVTPIQPRAIESNDLKFDSNLLHLRKDRDGNPKPESPSSLEKLMVSPLAWVLSRLSVQAQEWAPEKPDVLIQGTLAHHVFEILFCPGEDLPLLEMIPERAKTILDDGILKLAPFLRGNQWRVERANLLSGIIKAAQEWRQILEALGAQVIGSEQWLKGEFSDISVIGQADSLIKLPNEQILVVDYKRSSSGSRKPRMEKAYDSQAYLYITMLKTGATVDIEDIDITSCIKNNKPGIIYYMLNDQSALTDFSDQTTRGISSWSYISDDVSSNAIEFIQTRLNEIKKGEIKLNRSTDEGFFNKDAGIKPYALDDTPLIALFTQNEMEVEE